MDVIKVRNKVIKEIIIFIEDADNQEALFDHIADDLKICLPDNALSQIYDPIEEKYYDISLEDVIKAVLNKVSDAVTTFIEE